MLWKMQINSGFNRNSRVEWGSHFKILQSFLAKNCHFADIRPKRRKKERNSCYFETQPRDHVFLLHNEWGSSLKKVPFSKLAQRKIQLICLRTHFVLGTLVPTCSVKVVDFRPSFSAAFWMWASKKSPVKDFWLICQRTHFGIHFLLARYLGIYKET